MSTRIENGSTVSVPRPAPAAVQSQPVAAPAAAPQARRQEFRDGFESQGPRRDLFQPASGTARADLPKLTVAELMRTGSASVPSTAQAEALVKEAYSQVLMREPDAGGAQLYKDKALELARNGASEDEIRETLRQELAGSPEGQAISAVNAEFQSELGRTPESKGYWHEQALQWQAQGASVEEIHQRLQSSLHASPERALSHPEEFLNTQYQRLLGRDADGEGLATYTAKMQEMNAAGASFEDISQAIEQDIKSSPEYQTRQTQQTSSTSQVGGLAPSDQELAARVNKELEGTGLAGQGETIVAAARKERVPVDLMMSMLQKESSFLAKENNLSIANNNPGNLRWASDGWEAEFGGKAGGPGGFTTFPSVDKGIEAMAHLLGTVYRDEIDAKDYRALVNKYCPPGDQPGGQADTDLYVKQMNEWTQNWQQKLGVDSNWINTPPAGGSAPASSSGATPSTPSSTPASLKGITPSQINDAAGFSDQWSLCGPIAAVAASRAAGKPVSLEEARQVAINGGNYTPGDGMHGAESEVRLLKDLGVPAHTESPVDWDKVKAQVQSGKPVIISTPNHYFVIEGYDASTGKFDCGNSALAMKASGGTQTYLTPSDLANWGGGAPTAIVLD